MATEPGDNSLEEGWAGAVRLITSNVRVLNKVLRLSVNTGLLSRSTPSAVLGTYKPEAIMSVQLNCNVFGQLATSWASVFCWSCWRPLAAMSMVRFGIQRRSGSSSSETPLSRPSVLSTGWLGLAVRGGNWGVRLKWRRHVQGSVIGLTVAGYGELSAASRQYGHRFNWLRLGEESGKACRPRFSCNVCP